MAMIPSTFSASALAVELRVDRRTMGLILANVPPHEGSDRAPRWRLRPVVDALIARDRARRSSPADFDAERARLTRAKATMAEREERKQAGELVPADDVLKAWSEIVRLIRQRLLLLPARVAPECVGAATEAPDRSTAEALVRAAVAAEVFAALTELGNAEVRAEAPIAVAPEARPEKEEEVALQERP